MINRLKAAPTSQTKLSHISMWHQWGTI